MSYATLEEARAEGITLGQASDLRLQQLLDEASAFIDEVTGWWFNARSTTLHLDGGRLELVLPAPVVTLTSVALDPDGLSSSPLDLASVVVYGRIADPLPDRFRPRLVRRGRAAWPQGERNVVVTGTFGFVLANGTSPPAPIREACIRLAVRSLALLGNAAGQAGRRAAEVIKEITDGHSYELATQGAWRRSGATGDPDIDTILLRHRRPSGGLA